MPPSFKPSLNSFCFPYRSLYRIRQVTLAQSIFEHWISLDAEEQVNIKGDVQKALINAIESKKVDSDTFKAAEHEVFQLMSADSFGRFKQR